MFVGGGGGVGIGGSSEDGYHFMLTLGQNE